jgi:two-component system sensor histidine kinase UhpB
VSLFWRVFLANTLVLVIALLLLTFSPITVDFPIHSGQFLALFVGFVVLAVMNFVLMRRLIAPLERLTDVMSTIDPDAPGTRLTPDDPRSPEGKALSHAFNGMLDRLETARREAARSALEAQESERLRVAQELHDEVGQTLTAVTIQAERAAEGDPSEARRALRDVADSVRDSLDEVRRIARELRPEALDDLGLVNALIALSNRLDSQDGASIERDLQGTMPPLPPEVELVLYRIAQESLTNALRHANARTITLGLHADGGSIALRVRDDGDGMPRRLPSGASGITGMRERALLVGGRLAIESIPKRGTEVRLRVPLGRNGR